MAIVKKAKIKCPNKKCKTMVYKQWNLGILPRLLSLGSMFFKCRECGTVFHVDIPMYMVEKFLDAMASDPTYKDGEFIPKRPQITVEEEELFVKMMEEQPIELMDMLSAIEKIDMGNYKE